MAVRLILGRSPEGELAIRTLVLIPTSLERKTLGPILADRAEANGDRVELCGFGLVASAARTAALLAEHRPRRALLLGIAGGYGDRSAVGEAVRVDEVVCDGIGVGVGAERRSASELGWSMIEAEEGRPGRPAIGERIVLREGSRLLVSCCSASANPVEAAARHAEHPNAVAEDMEGFAVALSCRLAGVPLAIVRGLSNVAGDRDHSRWRVEAALRAAAELAIPLLEGDESE